MPSPWSNNASAISIQDWDWISLQGGQQFCQGDDLRTSAQPRIVQCVLKKPDNPTLACYCALDIEFIDFLYSH